MRGCKTKKAYVGGVWIFPETTHSVVYLTLSYCCESKGHVCGCLLDMVPSGVC